jgi:hypothetical protein
MTPRLSLKGRLLAGTAFLFGLRLLLSLIRSGPVLVADEIGYLTNARVLTGGVGGQLEIAPFYRGGYSLLIAPLIELSSDPTVVYHLVLALNAALAASIFPLLYVLLSRYGGVPSGVAIWAALAGALYPAVTVLSQVAMSENALFPLVCVWLIAFAGLLQARDGRRSMLWAAGVGASTGALWVVHNRMIAAVAVTLAVLLWLAVRRRIAPSTLAVAVIVLAAAGLGTQFLDHYLIDHNYGGAASDEVSERLDSLVSASGLRTAAANLIGQTWYLLVATFGLAAVLAGDFAIRMRGRTSTSEPQDRAPPLPLVGILLAFTVVLLVVSAAAFPERTRPDMLIYGRYTEVAAPALIALGIAVLSRARATRRVAVPALGFALLTGVVVLIRATASDPDAANRWNISALPFVTMQLGPAILIGAALVAAGGALLLRQDSRRSPPLLGGIAITLLLAVAAYGAWNPVRSSQRAVYPDGWTSPRSVADRHSIRRVAYDLDHYDTIGLYVPQWFLPDTSVVLFHGSREPPPAPYVLSAASWKEQHPTTKGRAIWRDAGRDELLWKIR